MRTASDRDAGDRGPRRQPHLRPPPLVPGRASPPELRRTATTTCGAPTSRPNRRSRLVFPDEEDEPLAAASRRGRRRTTSTASTAPNPTSTSPTPGVRDEIAQIMGFWLELGISGFRVDAVPFLIDPGADDDVAGAGPARPPAASCGRFLERRVSERRHPARREVNLPYPEQREYFVGSDDGASQLTMQFDFIARQTPLPVPGAAGRAAPRPRPEASTGDVARVAVGNLRSQPRRAHPRQAHGQAARRGVRRLRPRPRHAALRQGAEATAASDAGRGPAAAQIRLQPVVLAPGHPRALLRGGDRHGREPRHPRPARRPDSHAVERRPQRRLPARRSVASAAPGDRGRLRARARQRGRSAHRPRLVARASCGC